MMSHGKKRLCLGITRDARRLLHPAFHFRRKEAPRQAGKHWSLLPHIEKHQDTPFWQQKHLILRWHIHQTTCSCGQQPPSLPDSVAWRGEQEVHPNPDAGCHLRVVDATSLAGQWGSGGSNYCPFSRPLVQYLDVMWLSNGTDIRACLEQDLCRDPRWHILVGTFKQLP